MALTDIDGKNKSEYDWYNAAYDNINTKVVTNEEFGKGKSNTNIMINKWNNKEFGEQDKCSEQYNHKDIWGVIQDEVKKGWYVPSQGEWAAFAEGLGINKGNYKDKELSIKYWSSSQYNSNNAYFVLFNSDMIDYGILEGNNCVRLGVTF